jgi:hypothetical protein
VKSFFIRVATSLGLYFARQWSMLNARVEPTLRWVVMHS